MFSLTSAAAQQIQKAAMSIQAEQMALRVAARRETDGSIQYGMGFDDPKDEDMKLDLEGISIVISEDSQEILSATVLDFVALTPGEFSFIFIDETTFPVRVDTRTDGGCGSGSCSSNACGTQGSRH